MNEILVLDKSLVGLIHYCPDCGALTRPAPDFLTMAELEVLVTIGKGKSRTGTAKIRNVSVATIESHVSNLCQKLGIERGNGMDDVMVMLAREAFKLGLSKL